MVAEIRPGKPERTDAKLTVIKPTEAILPFAGTRLAETDQEDVSATADFTIPEKLPKSQRKSVELVLLAQKENRLILQSEIDALFPKALTPRNARISFSSGISHANPMLEQNGWKIKSVGSIQAHGKNIESKDGTWRAFQAQPPETRATQPTNENGESAEKIAMRHLRIEITLKVLKSIVNPESKRLPKSPVRFTWETMRGEGIEIPKEEFKNADEYRKLILESISKTLINIENRSPEEKDIINMAGELSLDSEAKIKSLMDSVSRHFSTD